MKNVVLITIDCLRGDRCGFSGHHRDSTPQLDQLAKDALIYDNCYATGSYTTESFPGIPSRTTLLQWIPVWRKCRLQSTLNRFPNVINRTFESRI